MAEQPHFDDAIMTTSGSAVPHLSDQSVCFVEDNANVHRKIELEYQQFPTHCDGELLDRLQDDDLAVFQDNDDPLYRKARRIAGRRGCNKAVTRISWVILTKGVEYDPLRHNGRGDRMAAPVAMNGAANCATVAGRGRLQR